MNRKDTREIIFNKAVEENTQVPPEKRRAVRRRRNKAARAARKANRGR